MSLVCIAQTIANIKAGSKILEFQSFQQLTKFAKLGQPHLIVIVNWDIELRGSHQSREKKGFWTNKMSDHFFTTLTTKSNMTF